MPLSSVGKSLFQIPLTAGAGIGLGVLLQKHYLDDKATTNQSQPDPASQYVNKLSKDFDALKWKLVKLETELTKLNNSALEQKNQPQQPKFETPIVQTNSNVFELSKIIEANDLASSNRHTRELDEQRKALIKEHTIATEAKVSKIHNKYKPVLNKARELEIHLQEQKEILKKEAPARLVWFACQGLFDKLKYSKDPEPLNEDRSFQLVKRFASSDGSALASVVVSSIPRAALDHGVCSEDNLKDRFYKLEKLCKRVALVSEHGGGLGKYLVSFLQSIFVFEPRINFKDEIEGKKLVDPSSWSTFDIIARVKCCLLDHDIEQAVRYANQLRGQARLVASDWIKDARVHLETRQAIEVISAFSTSINTKAINYSV